MKEKKRYSIKNILLATLWGTLGGATIFLLVAAIKSKGEHRCKGIEINIHGVSNNFFVDKKDIENAITASEKINPVGKTIGSFNLKKMELELEKDVWIKSAELFFDNNEILQVTVYEREPVARIFSTAGSTFYIDNELAMLPLSEKFSARLPVFTGFPTDSKVLSMPDSSLLLDIKNLSLAIQKDSFSMAMIEQIDITPQRLFEMIPKIGNQIIVFGDGKDVNIKLDKLKLFYKEIMVKAGWNKYSVINVQYRNQVVTKRRDAADIAADSLRTLQLMKMIAEKAEQAVGDSLQTILPDNDRNTVDSTMIQQSIQRDATDESAAESPEQPQQNNAATGTVVKPIAVAKENKPAIKPVQKPATNNKDNKQPKAVMKKQNDY